jgi:hypothetical protein
MGNCFLRPCEFIDATPVGEKWLSLIFIKHLGILYSFSHFYSTFHSTRLEAVRATDKILEKRIILWILGDKRPSVAPAIRRLD